jgi:hypothetical protein
LKLNIRNWTTKPSRIVLDKKRKGYIIEAKIRAQASASHQARQLAERTGGYMPKSLEEEEEVHDTKKPKQPKQPSIPSPNPNPSPNPVPYNRS